MPSCPPQQGQTHNDYFSDEGARNWGRIASLIETAKMNGVDPAAYLTATLEAIARGHSKSRLDELLPWAARPAST
jgi:transposase